MKLSQHSPGTDIAEPESASVVATSLGQDESYTSTVAGNAVPGYIEQGL